MKICEKIKRRPKRVDFALKWVFNPPFSHIDGECVYWTDRNRFGDDSHLKFDHYGWIYLAPGVRALVASARKLGFTTTTNRMVALFSFENPAPEDTVARDAVFV